MLEPRHPAQEPKDGGPAEDDPDDEDSEDGQDGHGDFQDLSVLGSSSAATSSCSAAPSSLSRKDSLLSRLASQLGKCKLVDDDESTKAPSTPSAISMTSILCRVKKNEVQETQAPVPHVFAGNGKNSGKVVTDLPEYAP